MASTRVHLVLVHGLFSSAKVWKAFETLIAGDPELTGRVSVHLFEYDSPLGRLRPDRRVAETDDIADQLGTFLETELADAERIVLVTHSQGGLVVQRFLARKLWNGEGAELARIGGVADSYWEALEGHGRAWRSLGLSFDPFAVCREALGAHWPGGVAVGRRGGRELGDGVAREPNQGFLVHVDDASREYAEDLLDTPLIGQFAFNLYLSVPPSGGETVLWRHRWQPEDERYRLPASYGYDEAVVRGAESLEIAPRVGEALLIDPRYFHAVRPSSGARRVALGFAVGLASSGQLVTWA